MKKKNTDQRVDTPGEEFSLIPHETLLALYRNLLTCREANAQGKRGSAVRRWPFDAAAIAVAQDLVAEDTVIADAVNPASQVLTGKRHPSWAGYYAALQLCFDIQLQGAVGAALAHKTKETGRVSAVFSRAAIDKVWREALEVARVHRLPMIFVRASKDQETNNRRTKLKSKADLEPGTELPHIIADGDDAVAMYRVAHEAIHRARRNRGATLIECIPFRVAGRRHQNAIASMETYLRGKGLLS